jgi:CRISPR-associated protein Cas2
MLEPAPGLYAGTLSAKVRDELWAVVAASVKDGAAILIHPADNEQHFTIRTAGERRRTVSDLDGLLMIALNPAEPDNEPATPLQ